jgi:regulator of extracellular matrix RemA (YlzA/DUF370 family)
MVAVASYEAAPIRRLVASLPLAKVIDLTGGRQRRAVVILDSDHAVLTALDVAEVAALLRQHKEKA